MKRTFAVAAALIAALSLALPTAGIAGKTKKVKVLDDYYSPTDVKIKKNKEIAFKWDGDNLNTHNVVMKKGPDGVKKSKKPCAKGKITKCNMSAAGSIGINFKPTFNKAGTYKFICTIHPTVMKMTVKVNK